MSTPAPEGGGGGGGSKRAARRTCGCARHGAMANIAGSYARAPQAAELRERCEKAEAESKRRKERIDRLEREVFALEKTVEEKDAKFSSFETTARKQIKMLEGRLAE